MATPINAYISLIFGTHDPRNTGNLEESVFCDIYLFLLQCESNNDNNISSTK